MEGLPVLDCVNNKLDSVTCLYPEHYNETDDMEMDSSKDTHNSGMISDDVMPYIYTINLSIVFSLISLFGIITNVINVTVFVRQGFRETINISLMGLAISDLCSLVSLLWMGICYSPFFRYADTSILSIDLQYYTGSWIHQIFTRVTIFITAFITFERCLCVVYPLKVKHVLTPNRVIIVIIVIYVFIIGSMSQNYSTFYLGWKYVPRLNKTMIGMIFLSKDRRQAVTSFNTYFHSFCLIFSFTFIVVCTCVLIYNFKLQMKWRQRTATGESKDRFANRDRQVIKMVLYVAIVSIVSFTPSLILFVTMIIIPSMNIGKENENLFTLFFSIPFTSDAINSSVNFFVYYKTSSKYKEQFQTIFVKQKTSS